MLIRNLNMPKPKWDGAEEPTMNNRSQPQYLVSIEVDRNTPWLQVSSGTHLVNIRDTCQMENIN